ncbi:hypothetical protein MH117_09895 [Paenibacillus sp. ACRRX]|uniref:hypothetical protein n=1 Tax=Paenibacillus sp. ACRRX TaxID=2918206 RepID=UPI001EF433EF|nr:hypothetical protein [Paenibacillus sp. ACRRX]MCG7407735.1 hypothetical protein [Paenibacillus sp. ACRRX]
MREIIEVVAILALAATGGFVFAQGGIFPAIIVSGAAFVFAVPKLTKTGESNG